MKRTLIINVSGIGDIISGLFVANPLLDNGHEIHILIPKQYAGLFSGSKYIEHVDDELPKLEFDFLVDLTSDKTSRKLVDKLNSKVKLGRAKNFINRIKYSRTYSAQVEKYPSINHIVYDFEPVLSFFNIKPYSETYFINDVPKKESLLKKEVCIHVGARNRLRCIPFDLIIDTCLYLESKSIPVRLIGNEVDIVEKVLDATNHYPIYELGGLKETKHWIQEAQLVVAPDSGIFHVASALNVNTIGIYGPNTYERSGSINPNARCIELDYSCRPCNQNEPCPYQVRCLNNITFEQIKDAIDEAS